MAQSGQSSRVCIRLLLGNSGQMSMLNCYWRWSWWRLTSIGAISILAGRATSSARSGEKITGTAMPVRRS
jgi:hypothetical protein